jgi:hypothetical protein
MLLLLLLPGAVLATFWSSSYLLRYIYISYMRLLIIMMELTECLDGQSSEHTFSFITGMEMLQSCLTFQVMTLKTHMTRVGWQQRWYGGASCYHLAPQFYGYCWLHLVCSLWGNCISIFELYCWLVISIWWTAMNWILEHLILQKLQIGNNFLPQIFQFSSPN